MKIFVSLLTMFFSVSIYSAFAQLPDSWTQKANFGGGERRGAIGFSIGTKGYIGTGISSTFGVFYNDLWEWDSTNDTWTQKASFSIPRYGAIGFSIGNKGYIGTGNNGSGTMNDFWEWDQTNNTWIEK